LKEISEINALVYMTNENNFHKKHASSITSLATVSSSNCFYVSATSGI